MNGGRTMKGRGVRSPPHSDSKEWILCGQINLHKSAACAAQLVSYINYALQNARLDGHGVINAKYPESTRSPRTVAEWAETQESRTATIQVQGDDDAVTVDAVTAAETNQISEFQKRLNSFLAQARRQTTVDSTPGYTSQNENGSLPSGFIFATQEVNSGPGKLTNISGATCIFDKAAKSVRAALIVSQTVNAWPVDEFTVRDLATAYIQLSSGKFLYVASYYGDCTSTPISRLLKALVAKASVEKAEIIIMGDLNSHSQDYWNDKRTCNRGKVWETFILDKNLMVHNHGDTFTFNTKKGQSIIDVTLSTAGIGRQIMAWQVVDAVPSSDHASIQFALQVGCSSASMRWNFRKCDWQTFTERLEKCSSENLDKDEWGLDELEVEASRLLEDMTSAVESCCPKQTVSSGMRKVEWRDSECKRLEIRMHSIRKYLRWHDKYNGSNRAKYTYDDLLDSRRAYKSACRRAKRRSWRVFSEEVDSNVEVAYLNKAFNKKVNQEIGLLNHPNGRLCSPKESIALLCGTHFPKCLMTPPIRPRTPLVRRCWLDDEKADFINEHRIKIVAKSFGPFKGPGPDALPPCVYQHLGPGAITRLCRVYKASYLLGFMPESWRKIKVIFIPKPDKPSYSVPKAFRPISLMSFMMKILEKLLLWEFEDTCLRTVPHQDEQHGFRKQRGCDSCLTKMYGDIEHSLIKKEYTVAVYLDVEGAYDNLQNHCMEQALRARGATEEYIHWYGDFFYYRHIHINHKGVEMEAYPVQGAPQGGGRIPHALVTVV